jgi:hypothetical protein
MQIAIKGVKEKMHTGIFLLSIHPEDLRKCPAVTTGSGDPVAYGQKTAGRARRWQLTVAKRLYCSEFSGVPIK